MPLQRTVHAANLHGLDYRAEARRLGTPVRPIIDMHTHINGERATPIYKQAADLFGVRQVYSMTHLEHADVVRDVFGDSIRFIAVPNWGATDRLKAFTTDWLDRIERYAAIGCRICKFWAAPRSRDIGRELGEPDLFALDGPWRRRAMDVARGCGMMFMTHVADPDTWFAAKYADASRYGTKLDQYKPFERLLDEYGNVPWIAAHMAGNPEDLDFLDALLARHDNLSIDTSATKWMVREISRHPHARLVEFLTRWRGRIMFGSDIVTTDEHLRPTASPMGMGHLAGSAEEAFDLYASRYYAQRLMWESGWSGPSPIADPDLAMVEPERYDALSSPPLAGRALAPDLLASLYHDAAADVLNAWHESKSVLSSR